MKKGGAKKKARKNGYALAFDVIIIALGILVTLILTKFGVIDVLVNALQNYSVLASFCAGLFFTSTFTIAPASVAIVRIASHVPIPSVALWGALGAMCGDLVLFFFIKDRFAGDVMNVISPSAKKHFLHSFHFGFLKWLSPFLGAAIIASPLPDEFAVSLMGISKVRASVLMPVSFIGNIIGIYLIIGFANLIA